MVQNARNDIALEMIRDCAGSEEIGKMWVGWFELRKFRSPQLEISHDLVLLEEYLGLTRRRAVVEDGLKWRTSSTLPRGHRQAL